MSHASTGNSSENTQYGPELIITGIPRSGTSFLCNLLHRFDNCVVLNEPAGLAATLEGASPPWGVPLLLRDRRADVLAGRPIENKVIDGQIITDTAIVDATQSYSPKVSSPGFVIGVKFNLPFLCRLPALRSVLPDARFVVCVRHPLDTIASWKGSFPHLRDARIAPLNIGGPRDPWLDAAQRRELGEIALMTDAAIRRAHWWRFLARLALQSLGHATLVRYEELALNPQEVARRILEGWPAGRERTAIEPSTIRRRRELLEESDIAAVNRICRETAMELGIPLDSD
jgi:sulfotransferase family protein